MKKTVLVVAAVFLLAGIASAQGWGGGWANARLVTVEGTLQLQNGDIALSSGNTIYFVPALLRYIGFIEGLKEGARVSVEGYSGGYNFIDPVKITINGKSYELAANGQGNPGRAYYSRGGYGGCGRGCW